MHSTTRNYDSGMTLCSSGSQWVDLYIENLQSLYFCSLQLEGSGNWPMDEIAIEKTKSSFLIQIGERWGPVSFICFSISLLSSV
jgi:hypothetical protein